MASTVRVFDPAGHVNVVEVEAAPRPASLDGLRPGILENRKPNARVLMEAMVEALRGRAPLGELAVGSKPVSGPPSRRTFEHLREHADFVLVGSSD
ncbi:MAG: hypothetical protein OXI03_01425 [Chloroflexota bacterium]|nr:hypothetical protein [Chloroflexota bacterium]